VEVARGAGSRADLNFLSEPIWLHCYTKKIVRLGETLRILTYTSLFPNEAQPVLGVFIYQRMAHVAARGNEVVVVAPIPYIPRWMPRSQRWDVYKNIPREERIERLRVYHPRYLLLPGISMPLHGLLMFVGTFFCVRRLHRHCQFQGIDAHYVYPDGFAAALIGKLLGLPVVVSARGTDMNLFPSFRMIRPLIRWTLENVAGSIAVCTALKTSMVEVGLPAEKVQVIGNGVDPARFQAIDQSEARRAVGVPESKLMLVAVGSLIPRKGYQFLLPAIAKITGEFPEVVLYIVGEGEARKKLEAQSETLGIRNRVVLVGNRPNEELKNWYSAAQVSCLVSSREGWPNVLLESMACGTPVVATGGWGVPEIITSVELGIIVDQNVESIAAGLRTALRRKWNPEILIRHSQGRNWDVVASEVEEYLQDSFGAVSAAIPRVSEV
jgi:teichuronic acid biosynthesis glycosyltransferase TuaC